MTGEKEIFFGSKDFPFNIFDAKGDRKAHALHHHDCLEINLAMGGSGINCIDGRQYDMRKGDLFLINNLEHHFALSQSQLKMKIIIFDPALVWSGASEDYGYVSSFYCSVQHGNRLVPDQRQLELIYALINSLEQENRTREQGYRLVIKAQLMELLALINRMRGAGVNTASYADIERIGPAIRHIHDDLCGDLSLETLAALSCMSKNYFSAYFKRLMGINVSKYIENAKVSWAQRALLIGNDKVTDICYECGYSSLSAFNAAFRRQCGQSPAEYRREHLRQSE